MTESELLEHLQRIVAQLGIEIRLNDGTYTGGICTLRGRKVLLMNTALPKQEAIRLLCRELAREDLAPLFILPAVRQRIELSRQPGSGISFRQSFPKLFQLRK